VAKQRNVVFIIIEKFGIAFTSNSRGGNACHLLLVRNNNIVLCRLWNLLHLYWTILLPVMACVLLLRLHADHCLKDLFSIIYFHW